MNAEYSPISSPGVDPNAPTSWTATVGTDEMMAFLRRNDAVRGREWEGVTDADGQVDASITRDGNTIDFLAVAGGADDSNLISVTFYLVGASWCCNDYSGVRLKMPDADIPADGAVTGTAILAAMAALIRELA